MCVFLYAHVLTCKDTFCAHAPEGLHACLSTLRASLLGGSKSSWAVRREGATSPLLLAEVVITDPGRGGGGMHRWAKCGSGKYAHGLQGAGGLGFLSPV